MHEASSSHATDRRCRSCGGPLALDNPSLHCSPCRAARRDYHPAHDPTLRRRLFEVLVHTRLTGRPVNVYRELGIEHCGEEAWICIKGHVRWLRRRGCLIEGSRDGTYRYLGRSGSRGRQRARHHGRL